VKTTVCIVAAAVAAVNLHKSVRVVLVAFDAGMRVERIRHRRWKPPATTAAHDGHQVARTGG
jgi:hypothetical protein